MNEDGVVDDREIEEIAIIPTMSFQLNQSQVDKLKHTIILLMSVQIMALFYFDVVNF